MLEAPSFGPGWLEWQACSPTTCLSSSSSLTSGGGQRSYRSYIVSAYSLTSASVVPINSTSAACTTVKLRNASYDESLSSLSSVDVGQHLQREVDRDQQRLHSRSASQRQQRAAPGNSSVADQYGTTNVGASQTGGLYEDDNAGFSNAVMATINQNPSPTLSYLDQVMASSGGDGGGSGLSGQGGGSRQLAVAQTAVGDAMSTHIHGNSNGPSGDGALVSSNLMTTINDDDVVVVQGHRSSSSSSSPSRLNLADQQPARTGDSNLSGGGDGDHDDDSSPLATLSTINSTGTGSGSGGRGEPLVGAPSSEIDQMELPFAQMNLMWQMLYCLTFFIVAAIIVGDIFGNSLVILSVCRHRKLRVTTNWFVVSLACADILVALFAMTFNASVILSGRWIFNQWVCDFWSSCDVLFSTASILHLCCISIDRFYAIMRPLDYPMKITTKTVIVMLTIVWISSALLSYIPIFTGWYTTTDHLNYRLTHPDECEFVVNRVYAIVSSSISFWIPCCIMLFTYWRIYVEATRQEKFIYKTQKMIVPNHHHQSKHHKQHKSKQHNSKNNNNNNNKHKQHRSKSVSATVTHHLAASGAAGNNGAHHHQHHHHHHNKYSAAHNSGLIATSAAPSTCSAGGAGVGTMMMAAQNHHRPSSTPSVATTLGQIESSSYNQQQQHQLHQTGQSPQMAANQTFNNGPVDNGQARHTSTSTTTSANTTNTIAASAASNTTNNSSGSCGNGVSTALLLSQNTYAGPSTPTGHNEIVDDRSQNDFGSTYTVQQQQQQAPNMEMVAGTNGTSNTMNDHHHHHHQQQCSPLIMNSGDDADLNNTIQQQQQVQPYNQKQQQQQQLDNDCESGQSTPTKRSISKMKREHKAAKTLGIIMGAFILCWLPFFSWYTSMHVCGKHCDGLVPRIMVTILFWIGYFNSTLNPLIYAYFNSEFRDAFKKTLQWMFCCCKDLKCLKVTRPNDNHYNCTYRSTQEIGLVTNS